MGSSEGADGRGRGVRGGGVGIRWIWTQGIKWLGRESVGWRIVAGRRELLVCSGERTVGLMEFFYFNGGETDVRV